MSKIISTIIIAILVKKSLNKVIERATFSESEKNAQYNLVKSSIISINPQILSTHKILSGEYKLFESLTNPEIQKKSYKFSLSGFSDYEIKLANLASAEDLTQNQKLKNQLENFQKIQASLDPNLGFKIVDSIPISKSDKEELEYTELLEALNEILPGFMDEREILKGKMIMSMKKTGTVEEHRTEVEILVGNQDAQCQLTAVFNTMEENLKTCSEFVQQVRECAEMEAQEYRKDIGGRMNLDLIVEDLDENRDFVNNNLLI